jgi:hypothetical protein
VSISGVIEAVFLLGGAVLVYESKERQGVCLVGCVLLLAGLGIALWTFLR